MCQVCGFLIEFGVGCVMKLLIGIFDIDLWDLCSLRWLTHHYGRKFFFQVSFLLSTFLDPIFFIACLMIKLVNCKCFTSLNIYCLFLIYEMLSLWLLTWHIHSFLVIQASASFFWTYYYMLNETNLQQLSAIKHVN